MSPRDFAFWAKSLRGQQKTRRKKHTLKPHSLKPISGKETTVQPIKATEGSSEKGKHAHLSKANSELNKTAVQPTKATEGEQREGRHTHSSKKKNRTKKNTVQPTKATEEDTLESTEMKRVTNDLTDTTIGSPLALEKNSACTETENV